MSELDPPPARERPLRWGRLYALVAGLLALEVLVFWLLSSWAR